MEKILSAWTTGTLQEYLQIKRQLEIYGKTDEDVERHIKDRAKNIAKSKYVVFEAIKCPKCTTSMLLESINVDPEGRDRVGSPEYKSWWRCPNDQTTIYNVKTRQEVIDSLGKNITTTVKRR